MQRRRRCIHSFAVGWLALLYASAPAYGELVTFEFSGLITTASGVVDGAPMLPFAVGNPISGSFTFDSESPDLNPISSTGSYTYSPTVAASISVGTLQIDYDFSTGIVSCNVATYCPWTPPDTFSMFTNEIMVVSGDLADQFFLVNAYAYFPSEGDPFNSEFQPLDIQLYGVQAGPSVITSDALPLVPYDVSRFQSATGEFGWRAPSSTGSATDYRGLFSITSMTLGAASPTSVPTFGLPGLFMLAALMIAAGSASMDGVRLARAALR